MRSYYRVRLGRRNGYVDEAYTGNFIAAGYIKNYDLTDSLFENWRDFNKKFIPIYLDQNPKKTKIGAGLACGAVWTVAKGILIGDIVLSPDGKGTYFVGEVIGNYKYHEGKPLPHRRAVRWLSKPLSPHQMSEALRDSAGSRGTVNNISKHAGEIEGLLSDSHPPAISTVDPTIEDPSVFALEKHLEDFLAHNWRFTDLGKRYDIYEEDGEIVGRQYPSDTGPIDILAVSKDKKSLLVVELKRGRASDVVIGQCQRYMGYVKEELTEQNQDVQGVIIAFEDDLKIRRALAVTRNIDFYTYKIDFRLQKM